MQHDDRVMLAYTKLARLSQNKRQLVGRDKFLLLAGAAACRAGWLEVADCCRAMVLEHNPQHLIGRFESFPAALRDPEFAPFLKQLERFCSYERAEHLLRELGLSPEVPAAETGRSPAAYALQALSGGVEL